MNADTRIPFVSIPPVQHPPEFVHSSDEFASAFLQGSSSTADASRSGVKLEPRLDSIERSAPRNTNTNDRNPGALSSRGKRDLESPCCAFTGFLHLPSFILFTGLPNASILYSHLGSTRQLDSAARSCVVPDKPPLLFPAASPPLAPVTKQRPSIFLAVGFVYSSASSILPPAATLHLESHVSCFHFPMTKISVHITDVVSFPRVGILADCLYYS